MHTAILECGDCGHMFRVGLGAFSALCCQECGATIEMSCVTGDMWNELLDSNQRLLRACRAVVKARAVGALHIPAKLDRKVCGAIKKAKDLT